MQTHQKKSISFSNTNQYHETISRGDYTVQELTASFYTSTEMRTVKEECRRTVAMMHGASYLGPHICTRGLEGRTMAGYQQKKQNKVFAYMAIQDEIARQRQLGIRDPQALADSYRIYTCHCASAAREMANLDHLEAVKVEPFSVLARQTDVPFFKREQITKPISIPKVRSYGPFCPAA